MSKITETELKRIAAKEYNSARAPFEIAKEKTALLVIDMLEAFVSPEGAYFLPESQRILPKIKKLIDVCRRLKVPVVYTTEYFHPKGYDKGLMWDIPINKGRTCTFIEGTKGVEIYHEIKPQTEDIVVVKKRYSAFHNTDLDSILRGLGRDTLIICGCMTNVCCGHTARDAFSRDYKVIFGSDINATDLPEVHEYELKTLRRAFALVVDSEEILKELKKT